MFSTVMGLALVVTLASSSPGGLKAGAASNVLVTYRPPSALVLHEPVIVEVELSNRSGETVRFDLGFNRQARFALEVKSPDGAVHTPQIAERGLGRVGRLVLGPGKSLSYQLLLNDWLPFDQIGVYHVSVRLVYLVLTEGGAVVETATSAEFQLVVNPPDPAVLERVYRRLTDTVIGNWPSEDRLNAARALSHVSNPAVLPFFKEILSVTDVMDPLVVEGLGRGGDIQARAVLADMAESGNSERSALARNALWRMTTRPR